MFKEDHSAEPFQVFIALSGKDKRDIVGQLEIILAECERHKPIQGIIIGGDYQKEVITPKWNNQKY